MRYSKDYYTLSTGRRFYAHLGILGLGPPEEDELSKGFYHGYDGGTDRPEDLGDPEPEPGPFTPVERREIATAMMERWRTWAGIPDALKEIEQLTDDPKIPDGTAETVWDLITRVHQIAANVLVFRSE